MDKTVVLTAIMLKSMTMRADFHPSPKRFLKKIQRVHCFINNKIRGPDRITRLVLLFYITKKLRVLFSLKQISIRYATGQAQLPHNDISFYHPHKAIYKKYRA